MKEKSVNRKNQNFERQKTEKTQIALGTTFIDCLQITWRSLIQYTASISTFNRLKTQIMKDYIM